MYRGEERKVGGIVSHTLITLIEYIADKYLYSEYSENMV